MKKLYFVFVLNLLVSLLLGQTPSDKFAPEVLAAINLGNTVDVLVCFREKADLSASKSLQSKAEKARFVFLRLQETASRAQQAALRITREKGFSANTLYLVNALAIGNADAALLRQLAELPETSLILADPWVQFSGPVPAVPHSGPVQNRNGVAWGLDKIQAPAVWALGYTGQGITVGGADTGYDWAHPAIQQKYRGWAGNEANSQHDYHWHDAIHDLNPLNADSIGNLGTNPCGLNVPVPCDDDRHGTHTMGTMTGSDNDNLIGVAPGAYWVGCRNMERGWGKPSTYIECFQWFLAPTDLGGQNPSPELAPHVINNSWLCPPVEGCTDLPINELIRIAIVHLKAAGVVVVVSNGNNGPACSTTLAPAAYFEESFSVGATRADDYIAAFSSRGPVLIDGSNRLKPNVSAPGHDVRSCIPGGDYANFSGTSMAGPHVAGLVALMLSANPALSGHVEEIEHLVEQTAVYFADTLDCGEHTGTAQPNHAYGWGRVDALAAVQAALQWQPPVRTVTPVLPVATVTPNPIREMALFTFKNLSGESALEVFNASGHKIFGQNWSEPHRETLRVSFEHHPPGIYFWRLRSGDGAVSNGKLLKG